jgi:HD-GYP domain-containing protein (c-di-GMP phosphodiesterase class II)
VTAATKAAVVGGFRILEARARMAHGVILSETYDFLAATSEFAFALQIAREEADPLLEDKIYGNLASWKSDVGLWDEALAMFEELAERARGSQDTQIMASALQNAAHSAIKIGDVARAKQLIARTKALAALDRRPTTVEAVQIVRRDLLECLASILQNEFDEAVRCAEHAKKVAFTDGAAEAQTLSTLADALAGFAAGTAAADAIDAAILNARRYSPSSFNDALEVAARMYEHVGQPDKALVLQRSLLEFMREQKFEQIRHILGKPSRREADGVSSLARLDCEIDRRVTDVIHMAIDQSLRAGYDYGRIFRVSRMVELFSVSEGWAPSRLQAATLGAKLIDIGNIVISDELLRKRRALREGERRIVAEHAEFGAELLLRTRLALFEPCVPVVRFHHEHWDGGGVNRLKGEDIPLEARVVALCDAFDALIHDRPWRTAFLPQEALRIITEGAGSDFDPGLAPRFVAWVQGALLKVDDLEGFLAVEASENQYVQTRKRVARLIQSAG